MKTCPLGLGCESGGVGSMPCVRCASFAVSESPTNASCAAVSALTPLEQAWSEVDRLDGIAEAKRAEQRTAENETYDARIVALKAWNAAEALGPRPIKVPQ